MSEIPFKYVVLHHKSSGSLKVSRAFEEICESSECDMKGHINSSPIMGNFNEKSAFLRVTMPEIVD